MLSAQYKKKPKTVHVGNFFLQSDPQVKFYMSCQIGLCGMDLALEDEFEGLDGLRPLL